MSEQQPGAVPGPNWYDVLDVDAGATTEEISTAWRAAIADLTPADRRFRLYNQAAEVLLDPDRRAAHDAALAREPAEGQEPKLPAHSVSAPVAPQAALLPPGPPPPGRPLTAGGGAGMPAHWSAAYDAPRPPWSVPTALLATLGLLAWVAVGVLVFVLFQPSAPAAEDAAAEARSAAERAVIPVLSYDYETLAEDQRAAHAVMTSDYRRKYDSLFAVLEENAPSTQAEVDVDVVASALTRVDADDERVSVLLFVDRPTTNRSTTEPVVYRDQATLTMQRVDGEWLVDDVRTSPAEQ